MQEGREDGGVGLLANGCAACRAVSYLHIQQLVSSHLLLLQERLVLRV